MPSLFAFLHHLAAFTLIAALAVEFVLIRVESSLGNARTLLRADQVFGIAAGVVLVVGLLRVFYFEKGASYYGHSAPFIAKISLFVLVGLLSIYPTVKMLSWRSALKSEQMPADIERQRAAIRTVLSLEVAGIVAILLCASLMAKGLGQLG